MSAIENHMAACRAILNVPNDETLAVAITELRDERDRVKRRNAAMLDVLKRLVAALEGFKHLNMTYKRAYGDFRTEPDAALAHANKLMGQNQEPTC